MSTKTTVHAVITAAFAYGEGIASLRIAFKGKARDAVTKALLPEVASHPKYLVPLVPGERKAAGTKVLDKTHANYEACRKALQRIVKEVLGEQGSSKTEEMEIPEAILKAAAQLAKLCAEYEGARKLASTAVAHAFSK